MTQQQKSKAKGRVITRDDLADAAAKAVAAGEAAAAAAEVIAEALEGGQPIEGMDGDRKVDAQEAPARRKSEGPPAYQVFLDKVRSLVGRDFERIQVEDLTSFVMLRGQSGHRIYVSKGATTVGRVTTDLPIAGEKGTIPIEEGSNGRITCHLDPTPENVAHAARLLARTQEPLPARRSRRPT